MSSFPLPLSLHAIQTQEAPTTTFSTFSQTAKWPSYIFSVESIPSTLRRMADVDTLAQTPLPSLPHPFAVAALPKRSTFEWFHYFFNGAEAECSLAVPHAWTDVFHNVYSDRFMLRISAYQFFQLYHSPDNAFWPHKHPIEQTYMWRTLSWYAGVRMDPFDNDDNDDNDNVKGSHDEEYQALTRVMNMATSAQLRKTLVDEWQRPTRIIPTVILQAIPEHMYRMADVRTIRALESESWPHPYVIAVLPKRTFDDWCVYFFGDKAIVFFHVRQVRVTHCVGKYRISNYPEAPSRLLTSLEFRALNTCYSDYDRSNYHSMVRSQLWTSLGELAANRDIDVDVDVGVNMKKTLANMSWQQLNILQASHGMYSQVRLRIPDIILRHIPVHLYRAAADARTIAVPNVTPWNIVVSDSDSNHTEGQQQVIRILSEHSLPHPYVVAVLPPRTFWDWKVYFFGDDLLDMKTSDMEFYQTIPMDERITVFRFMQLFPRVFPFAYGHMQTIEYSWMWRTLVCLATNQHVCDGDKNIPEWIRKIPRSWQNANVQLEQTISRPILDEMIASHPQ